MKFIISNLSLIFGFFSQKIVANLFSYPARLFRLLVSTENKPAHRGRQLLVNSYITGKKHRVMLGLELVMLRTTMFDAKTK